MRIPGCFFLLAASAAFSQGLDSVLNRKAISCWDIAYNAGELHLPVITRR